MKIQINPDFGMGYEDAGKGPVLVLLHAFPLARTMWQKQIDFFQKTHRVLATDLRGFGGTTGFEEAPSVEQMADDVIAFLTHLGVNEPVRLAGLSMGGYAALAFARRHPDRLSALILADTKAEPDNADARAGRDKLIEFMGSHSALDLIDQLMPKMISNETFGRRPDVVVEIRKIVSLQSNAGTTAAIHALRDRPDATPGLNAIRVPTLVVVGSDDSLTPPSAAEKLASSITGARLAIIPGAGHLSNMERPDLFNDAVGTFLNSLSTRI